MDMGFSLREGQNVFKHSIDEIPDLNDPDYLPHTHTLHYELFYFINGDAHYNIDGTSYEMRNGTLLLIKPGVVHNIVLTSNKPYERIVIRFKDSDIPEVLSKSLKETENIYFVRNSELSKEILRLDAHFSNINNDWIMFTLQNSLQIILSYVVNYRQEDTITYQSEDVQHIINYIEDHLTEIKDIDMICHDLNMSKSALCKKFTENVGVPVMSFVRLRKVMMANNLLQEGRKPTEVYQECGFNDYTTFYRSYKKYFQEEPANAKKHAV